jgi:uncharacterized membrane protein YkvA (DUF1232 family)
VAVVAIALRDPRTPWLAWAIGAAVVAYAVSPIDLIPDFVPVLGWLDDLLVVPLGIWLVLRLIPPEVLVDARAGAATEAGPPASAVGAVLVVAAWVLAAAAAGALLWWATQVGNIFEAPSL